MDTLREAVKAMYPNLHSQTYCVPPVYFKRVQYATAEVAGQSALVLPQSSASSNSDPHPPSSSSPSGTSGSTLDPGQGAPELPKPSASSEAKTRSSGPADDGGGLSESTKPARKIEVPQFSGSCGSNPRSSGPANDSGGLSQSTQPAKKTEVPQFSSCSGSSPTSESSASQSDSSCCVVSTTRSENVLSIPGPVPPDSWQSPGSVTRSAAGEHRLDSTPGHHTELLREHSAKSGHEDLQQNQVLSMPPTEHTLWPTEPDSEDPGVILESDTRDDFAQEHVLLCFQEFGISRREVMFVLSQLHFTGYLNKPSYSAATELFPKPMDLDEDDRRGDFDLLLIHRVYGILLGELKSVGLHKDSNVSGDAPSDKTVTSRVLRAIKQLDKSERVVKYMASDLAPTLMVRKTLILPYVSKEQLQRCLRDDPKVEKALRACLGAPEGFDVTELCVSRDQLSHRDSPHRVTPEVLSKLDAWWQLRMAGVKDPCMTPDVYLDLVARLAGPATSVRMHCVVPPRMEVRTEGQVVCEVGKVLSRLVLTPQQQHLLAAAPRLLCLAGPPGTGKTVVLTLRGLQSLRSGSDVLVVSTSVGSLAVSHVIYQQLVVTLQAEALGSQAAAATPSTPSGETPPSGATASPTSTEKSASVEAAVVTKPAASPAAETERTQTPVVTGELPGQPAVLTGLMSPQKKTASSEKTVSSRRSKSAATPATSEMPASQRPQLSAQMPAPAGTSATSGKPARMQTNASASPANSGKAAPPGTQASKGRSVSSGTPTSARKPAPRVTQESRGRSASSKTSGKATPRGTPTSGAPPEAGTPEASPRRGKPFFFSFDPLTTPSDLELAINAFVQASQGQQPPCVLMDEAVLSDKRVAPFIAEMLRKLTARFPDISIWMAALVSTNVPDGFMVEYMTLPLRSAPVVTRQIQSGVDKLSSKLVRPYTGHCAASPCDGPRVITLRHEGQGHIKKWPVNCPQCGRELAKLLRQLDVGPRGSSSSLHYSDVFVITRSQTLHDDVKDEDGRVTSPASGIVQGLRGSGFPVRVLNANITDRDKWEKGVADTALARYDQVTVVHHAAVLGLERKLVIWLPGWWKGVDDSWSSEAIDAVDRVFSVSRCSAQLVVIETPCRSEEEEAAEEEEEEEGEERSKEDGDGTSSKTASLWPLYFSTEDQTLSH